jgi:hypothetical protein
MNAKTDLAARAAAIGQRPARTPAKGAGNVRTKPVRLSLDLGPQQYRRLNENCTDLALDLGVLRIHQSQVLRALIELFDTNPTVRDEVREHVEAELRNSGTTS